MNMKDLIIRFTLGGTAVMLSYIMTIISPWKILSGIFAAFPAVMITAILMVGIGSGSKNAAKIANGSVLGMVGGVICVTTVWIGLIVSQNWLFSVMLGLLCWLGSSFLILNLKERIKLSGIR